MTSKEILATLVFDSFNEPLPLGVRRRDLTTRQALYTAGQVQLDLKIEAYKERELIVGQIFADSPDMTVSDLQIDIIESGDTVCKSRTNALGEFIFQDLPKGNYTLRVVLSDTMVRLPLLSLDN
jgi:hypothetical protein